MLNIIKRFWKYFTLIISIAVVFILIGFNTSNSTNITSRVDDKMSIKKQEINKTESEKNEVKKTVFVDVKGSVNNPGVYELESDKRVINAIDKAGGLTNNADTINLNLSKKLEDEMIIIVYSKVEISNYYKNNGNKNATCASLECVCPDNFNNACISEGTSKNKETKNEANNKLNGKVSINNASKEELMTLSGIGESKAEKIISYRNENGGFSSVEDIKKVSGIGDSVYEKIKDNITL